MKKKFFPLTFIFWVKLNSLPPPPPTPSQSLLPPGVLDFGHSAGSKATLEVGMGRWKNDWSKDVKFLARAL